MNGITKILKLLYPKFIWEMPNDKKVIYLTFDDGPIPEVTEFVLEQLNKFEAKATFFCVGDNILKNPIIFDRIIANHHTIGNHTFSHIKGWNNSNQTYLEDIKRCQNAIEEKTQTNLFRPPYGRIKRAQANQINEKIVMWSVLTRDYDASFRKEKCLKKAIKATQNGSIVLFHDSLKAQKNLYYVLPKYLEYFSKLGYKFMKL